MNSHKVRPARALATIAMAAILAAGVSGCQFAAPVATLHSYNQSDGANLNAGSVHLNNTAWVADDAGEHAQLIGQLSNNGEDDAIARLTLSTGQGDRTLTWLLAPSQVVDLQAQTWPTDESDAGVADASFTAATPADTRTTNLGSRPGATVRASLSATSPDDPDASTEPTETSIPVLGGNLAEYRSIVPSPSPSPTIPSLSPGRSPSPSPSPAS